MPAPDIRSFFAQKGGATPVKPEPKKPEEDGSKSRRKSRKVIQDSDDDEPIAVAKKPATKPPTKKTTEVKGVEMSASQYFASADASKSETATATPKPERKSQIKIESPLRVSPRLKKQEAAAPAVTEAMPTSAKRGRPKGATTFKRFNLDDDGDAYMDEAEDDDADDIFAADIKGCGRGGDNYEEEDSNSDVVPVNKRSPSSRARPAGSKKRKSPERETDDEEEEDAPPKKTAKPKAPRKSKAKGEKREDPTIQNILDNIPTVRPPTPPPQDPNAKFDWRKATAGGNSSAAPPMAGSSELPEGEEACLTGLTFVFTGVLQTLGRDEAQSLVKKYGGKVTTAPSSKTSFVVLGDGAGPSKVEKLKKLGIKTINEEGLFELIRKLPAHGGSGLNAVKAQVKKAEEQKKIIEEAERMEEDEAARRLAGEKAAKKAAAARGIPAEAPKPPPVQLWTSKHAPTQMSHICGNKANVEKIQTWLRNWPKHKKYNFQKRGADGMGGARAIIISGPPGIGKTTSAHLAAKLEGYDVLESNASDTRSKKLVESGVSDVMNNTSLLGFFAGDGKKVDMTKKKIVLIMDEVDGMSAGDRGGVGALAKFCRKTEVPLILICNERRLPKMKPFDQPIIFDIKFSRPTVEQIRSRMMTICHREGLKIQPAVLDAVIEGSGKDIRQIINMMSTAKLDQLSMSHDQGKAMARSWEKHVILKPWDICQKMLAGGLFAPSSKATLNDKIELYFNDHEFSYLMIQENYIRTKPMATINSRGLNKRQERLKELELFDAAAQSISDGDLVDRMIHGPQQQWSLMPTHAVFSSVRPASLVAGQLMGSTFTTWLGNNSKYGKLSRFVREIHSHMRLRSSGDHNEVRQQYLPVLWSQMVKPISTAGQGKDAVDGVIELMDSYYLTREDFDSMMELGLGPQSEELVNIETQTKSTFTRKYNAMSHPVPFIKASNIVAPSKKLAKDAPDLEEAIEEEEAEAVEAEVVEEEGDDIKDDKYIKQPKAKRGAKKSGQDDGEGKAPAKPGKAKAKANAGRGKEK